MTKIGPEKFARPKLSLFEAGMAKAGEWAIRKFGIERTATFLLKIRPEFYRWYVRAMTATPECAKYVHNREFTLEDRVFIDMQPWSDGIAWRDSNLYWSDEAWEYLIAVATNNIEGVEFDTVSRRRVGEAIIRKYSLTWDRLSRLLDSKNLYEGQQMELLRGLGLSNDYGWVWWEGGKILGWILEKDNKNEILQDFSGHKLLGMAKSMSTEETWLDLIEEIIKINPSATLCGILNPAEVLDDGPSWGAPRREQVSLPVVKMEDFQGANRQIFSPWLVDKKVGREMRIKAVQWLVEFEKMETQIEAKTAEHNAGAVIGEAVERAREEVPRANKSTKPAREARRQGLGGRG